MSLVWYITGVSSGVGESLVCNLLKNGYRVAGTCRDIKKLNNNQDLVNNVNFLPLEVDLLNQNSIKESIDKVISHFGTISVVVNNAGFAIAGSIEETSNEEYKEIFDVMFFAPLNVIKSVLPHFRKQNFGIVFNIGSVAGFHPSSFYGGYGAAKSALLSISKSLYEELKEFNIKISYIAIGLFKTSIISDQNKLFSNSLIEEYNTKERFFKNSSVLNNSSGDVNKLSKVIIEYSKKDEIPKYIFCGGKELMSNVVTKSLKEIESLFNDQIINNNFNTNIFK